MNILIFLMKVVLKIVVMPQKFMTLQIILEYLNVSAQIYGLIKLVEMSI